MATPANIADGMGTSAHQKPPCHAATAALPTAATAKNARLARSTRGLSSGRVNTCRYSSGFASISGASCSFTGSAGELVESGLRSVFDAFNSRAYVSAVIVRSRIGFRLARLDRAAKCRVGVTAIHKLNRAIAHKAGVIAVGVRVLSRNGWGHEEQGDGCKDRAHLQKVRPGAGSFKGAASWAAS